MTELITQLPQVPERMADAHKGDFGRVLIVGGSLGMSGAVVLSGKAALRGGAGLVYLAVPESIQSVVAAFEPAYLTEGLSADEQGRLSASALEYLLESAQDKHAIAVGPGIGQSDAIDQIISSLYRLSELPLVVDADGLNSLARQKTIYAQRIRAQHNDTNGQSILPILTPHPGEFARMLDCSIKDVQNNRQEYATEFAHRNRVVLLLKGNGSVITDGTRLAINNTGNSGMATGGTGDVLTGLISALVGQGFESFAAAQLGAFLHGLAGDLAAQALTPQAMTATDLVEYLPLAWKTFLRDHR